MKNILVMLEDGAGLDAALATAVLAARRFGSLIEGLRVTPRLAGILAAGAEGGMAAAPPLEESFLRDQQEATLRLKDRFLAFMRAQDVAAVEAAGQPWHRFVEIDTIGRDVVGSRSRLFDVTVVGRPQRGAATPSAATLEAALFESGRPILIAPPTAPVALGDRILIAWNGSTETARAVAFAQPWLVRASRVSVLTVIGGAMHGPPGEEAAAQLRRHGVAAEAVAIEARERSTGEAILAACADMGADLLIKGAYTQSRLRQLIFGGATSHILGTAELPALMAH